MTSVRTGGSRRRVAKAAAAMYRPLLRWPSRDFFAELEPEFSDGHPVYELLYRTPRFHRLNERITKLARRIEPQVNPSQWFEFAERRALLEIAQVAAAFNIGFENGAIHGRTEAHTNRLAKPTAAEEQFVRGFRALLSTTTLAPEKTASLLLEVACGLLRGPPGRIAQRGSKLTQARPRRARSAGRGASPPTDATSQSE